MRAANTDSSIKEMGNHPCKLGQLFQGVMEKHYLREEYKEEE